MPSNVAEKDVRTLTDSSLDPVVDGLSKDDISKVIQERFQGLTGLVPPKKEELQAHINRQNSISRQILKLQPKSAAAVHSEATGSHAPAFNWTMKGYAAANSGIVTAVQNQQGLRLLLGLRDGWHLRGGLRQEQGDAHRGIGTVPA